MLSEVIWKGKTSTQLLKSNIRFFWTLPGIVLSVRVQAINVPIDFLDSNDLTRINRRLLYSLPSFDAILVGNLVHLRPKEPQGFLIFSKAVPSALLMSLEWELWPFQQFCDLFGTFVTFLWPFYDLFVTFMTFLWPFQHFSDLFMNDKKGHNFYEQQNATI